MLLYAFVLLQFLSCDDAIVLGDPLLLFMAGFILTFLFFGVVASIRGFDSRTDSKR